GDMEKGQLRCDANVSLHQAGTPLGTKTEIKNLNTIKGVERGVGAEIQRQAALLVAGGSVRQATLLYDAEQHQLAVMRDKAEAHDSGYFREPDLPVLRVSAAARAATARGIGELPWAREARFREQYALSAADAAVLAESRELADYFEACVPRDGAR